MVCAVMASLPEPLEGSDRESAGVSAMGPCACMERGFRFLGGNLEIALSKKSYYYMSKSTIK